VGSIADRLVRAAIERGTRDNITALVVRYEAEA
jgi:serine/threonine protein phosphatase PrpC